MKGLFMDLHATNAILASATPEEITKWAIGLHKRMVITTNFRPYEAAILHLITNQKKNVPVIWCDTGYNTSYTYAHAQRVMALLELDMHLYVPRQTSAYRDVYMGIPAVGGPNHALFTHEVKLEPFQRAMSIHRPEVWFTNLRKNQTEFRNSIDIVSKSMDGIIKVSPFYHYSDTQMDEYLLTHGLPTESRYYDPTKGSENRECGLHQ